MTEGYKRCCDCKNEKPLEAFHACSRAPDKRQYSCIECRADYDRLRQISRDSYSQDYRAARRAISQLLKLWKPPKVIVHIQSMNQEAQAQ